MSNIDTGGPAFPVADPFGAHKPQNVDEAKRLAEGMTMRDYFAAKAMPVHMAALSTWDAGSQEAWHNEIARISYAIADAMLKARES